MKKLKNDDCLEHYANIVYKEMNEATFYIKAAVSKDIRTIDYF